MKRSDSKKIRRPWWQSLLITFGAIIAAIITVTLVLIWIGSNSESTTEEMIEGSKTEFVTSAMKTSGGNISGGDLKAIDSETIEGDLILTEGVEDELDAASVQQYLTSKDTQNTFKSQFLDEANRLNLKHLTFNIVYLKSNGEVFTQASIPLDFD